ncbi:MAG: DUF2892 domain-containing protein [Nitrospirales bacterium]
MTHLCNLGHHERLIRVGLGLLFLAIGGFSIGPEWGNLLALGVGFIALLTGIAGYCPAWHMMGISTCHRTGLTQHPDQDHTAPQPDSRRS